MKLHRVELLMACVLMLAGCRSAQSAVSGVPTAGNRTGVVQFGGLTRTYLLHVPPAYDKTKPVPLLLAFHGGRGQGKDMEDLTLGGFNVLADREGFIVAYPDGVEKNWNDGRAVRRFRSQRENIDDVGFVSALINHFATTLNIDEKRVYATGISNGGIFSYRLACELSGKIAAIAPVAGAIAENIYPTCSPSRPVPVLAINSTTDPWLQWNGGEVRVLGTNLGRVISVPNSIAFWAAKNGCVSTVVSNWEPMVAGDGTRVRREVYGSCKQGADVVLYAVEGGGHTWPSGHQYASERLIGKTTRNLNADVVIWNFLKRHSL